ncbi:MAG: HEAT repeat domain-containing protein [Acidobacteria bacterium]|nr:HEAT repeat domain-containing protein [Acidobacteriota bacterium]
MNPGSWSLFALIGDPEPFLAHEDAVIRRLAVSVSAVAPEDHVAELLRLASEDSDPSVRAVAVEALGGCTEDDVSETLASVREDGDARVREAAATAYGELADPNAVDWLIDRARHDDVRRRMAGTVRRDQLRRSGTRVQRRAADRGEFRLAPGAGRCPRDHSLHTRGNHPRRFDSSIRDGRQ